MKINEMTSSGSIATVSSPIGHMKHRGKGVYPNQKCGNLFTGKKTKKKYANSVSENELKFNTKLPDIIKENSMNKKIKESLADDMMNLAKELGMNPRLRKLGDKPETKPRTEPIKSTGGSDSSEDVETLQKKLAELLADFDPNYQYSDDYSVYGKNHRIALQIKDLKNKLKNIKTDDNTELDEGTGAIRKVGGTLAVMAALMGLGNEITSAKHTPLGKALETAARNGDQEAAKHLQKLDTYLDTKQSALVTQLSNKYLHNNVNGRPVKPYPLRSSSKNESSIMKGIQNESKKMKGKDSCWKDHEMIGQKTKNVKKVPNCVPKKK